MPQRCQQVNPLEVKCIQPGSNSQAPAHAAFCHLQSTSADCKRQETGWMGGWNDQGQLDRLTRLCSAYSVF